MQRRFVCLIAPFFPPIYLCLDKRERETENEEKTPHPFQLQVNLLTIYKYSIPVVTSWWLIIIKHKWYSNDIISNDINYSNGNDEYTTNLL